MKKVLNIATLLIFLLGLIPFSVAVNTCKMQLQKVSPNSFHCMCEPLTEENSTALNSPSSLCCSTKLIEKEKVQEFSFERTSITKIDHSTAISSTPPLIESPSTLIVKRLTFAQGSPPSENLHILNSSLLI